MRDQENVLLSAGGMADHVHLVVKLKPQQCISDTVRVVKSNSARWLNEIPEYPGHFAWQTGYSAFSVSKSQLNDVLAYVANQKENNRYRSFQEEYREFLDRHEIEYDEEYLWG